MMAYFCSHAFWTEGGKQMWCDNIHPPEPVDNEKDCKNCSVGMIRRLRDGWEDYHWENIGSQEGDWKENHSSIAKAKDDG